MRKKLASLILFGVATLCVNFIGLGMPTVASATEIIPADHEPPVYQSIKVTPSVADVGGTVSVEVYATDNIAGVDTVIVTFENRGVNENLDVRPTRVGNTDLYKGTVTITSNLAKGRWDIKNITLYDRYDNYQEFTNGLPNVYFEIPNPNPDTQFPVVESATFKFSQAVEGKVVTVGDSVKFEVDATDDRGIQSIVGTLCDEQHMQFVDVEMTYDEITGLWVSEIPIHEYTRTGKWSMLSMTVTDVSWNKTELESSAAELANLYFNVQNPNNDISSPQVSNVEFSPSVVKPGETVKISVEAEDYESGMESVCLTILNPSPFREDFNDIYLTYNTVTNKWEGEIQIPLAAAEGDYELFYIIATDKFANKFDAFLEEFPEAKFTVNSSTEIKLNPSKTTVQSGEEFEVEVGVANVRNLQSAEMRISYDPTKLEVVDLDPNTAGTQVRIEGILSGLTIRNQVEDGLIIFNISKAGTQTFSGSGALATIKFKALNGGNYTTALDFAEAYLYSYDPLMPKAIDFTQQGTEIAVLGAGTVQGNVKLQGLTTYAGAKVSVAGTDFSAVTDEQGNFTLSGLPGGTYTLVIAGPDRKPVFLVEGLAMNVVNGETTNLASVILSTGDISGDNAVSLVDLSNLAAAYDSTTGQPKWNANADLNNDGRVGIIDLTLLATNWDKKGFVLPS